MKSFILKYLQLCCFQYNNNPDISYTNMSSDLVNLLQNIEYRDTTPFIPPIQYGKVIKVYDGDTITIASVLPHTTSPI